MIDASQIADLRVGDVVTVTDTRWGLGVSVTGPLVKSNYGSLVVGKMTVGHPHDSLTSIPLVVKTSDNEASIHASHRTLTVDSRSPRPFYVNVDRKPEPGDIFRSDDPADDDDNLTYSPTGGWAASQNNFWENISGDTLDESDLPPLRRLLIDGTTGKVVE